MPPSLQDLFRFGHQGNTDRLARLAHFPQHLRDEDPQADAAGFDDMDTQHCTIEEREEYEPHIDRGVVVFAGVDYEKILRAAENEVDIVLWDGGNNDLPFYWPDVEIVVADPRFSVAAGKAHWYLPVKPGTDTALLLAWIHVVLQEVEHIILGEEFLLGRPFRDAAEQGGGDDRVELLFQNQDLCSRGRSWKTIRQFI
mgnify:CR=1 FL=1